MPRKKKIKVTKGDKEALLVRLRELADYDDSEASHAEADDALIAFIGDKRVSKAYGNISKWYA